MQLLQSARSTVNKLCATAKRDYYQAKIKESAGDQKALYKVTDKLLAKNKTRQLPEHEDRKVLANGLAGYFKQKIDKLQETFPKLSCQVIVWVEMVKKRAPVYFLCPN